MGESTELNELFGALAKAQGEMKVAGLDSENPFFKSKYANLANIIHTTRPALTKNGLCIIQRILHNNGALELCTRLCHASGQWMESSMPIKPNDPKIQTLGGCITYAKRYSYTAICGVICSDDIENDDDGNVDSVAYKETEALKEKKPVNIATLKVSIDEVRLLEELIGDDETYRTELLKGLMSHYKIKRFGDMPKPMYLKMLEKVNEKVKSEGYNG